MGEAQAGVEIQDLGAGSALVMPGGEPTFVVSDVPSSDLTAADFLF